MNIVFECPQGDYKIERCLIGYAKLKLIGKNMHSPTVLFNLKILTGFIRECVQISIKIASGWVDLHQNSLKQLISKSKREGPFFCSGPYQMP